MTENENREMEIDQNLVERNTHPQERTNDERSSQKKLFVQPALERHGELAVVVGAYF